MVTAKGVTRLATSESTNRTPREAGTHRWSRAMLGLAALGIALALLQRWTTLAPWHPLDLDVYVAGGQAAAHGQDLYGLVVRNGADGLLRFTYPPFAALLFIPLAALGGYADVFFTALSICTYVVVVVLCGRHLGVRARTTCLVGALGLALEPIQRTLLFGQINLLLLALVLLDTLATTGRRRGVLVGLAAAIKLTPAVFVVYFLLRREYRAAVTAVVTLLVTILIGFLLLPKDSTAFWLHNIRATDRFGPEVRLWGNQSLTAIIDRAAQLHGLPPWLPLQAAILLSLSGLLISISAARAAHVVGRPLAALCAVALGGLLAAPVTWTHHYVWVMPVLFILVDARAWVLTGVTAVIFFLPPMWALAGRDNRAVGYTPLELALSSAWALWSVLVLTWLYIWSRHLWRYGPASRASGPDV